MRALRATNAYKKDLKKVSQYPNFDIKLLNEYTNKILRGEKLPESVHDHKLSKSSPKKYQGLRDFHLAPNICVLYRIEESTVIFVRIGSHSYLGLTESLV